MCTIRSVLADLAEAIGGLELNSGPEELLRAIALRDRFEARIAVAVGEVEVSGWWAFDAAATMTAWLRAHARMTKRSAQRLRTLAARLRSLPVCAMAYADGSLSALLDDEVIDVFAAQEAELVPYLVPLTVAGVGRAMAAWVARARPEPSEAREPDRALYLSRTLADRYVLDGSLDPEGGSVVAAAIRTATPDRPDVVRTGGIGRASTSWSSWTTSRRAGVAVWHAWPSRARW